MGEIADERGARVIRVTSSHGVGAWAGRGEGGGGVGGGGWAEGWRGGGQRGGREVEVVQGLLQVQGGGERAGRCYELPHFRGRGCLVGEQQASWANAYDLRGGSCEWWGRGIGVDEVFWKTGRLGGGSGG